MRTVLITRPIQEAEPLAGDLTALGFTALAEPLLRIEALTQNALLLEAALAKKPRALLATSKRALEVFAQLSGVRDIPLFCVGGASAEHASRLGFVCRGFSEDAQSLVRLTKSHLMPGAAPLLYIRGEDIHTDISAALETSGFVADSVILYRAHAAEAFSENLCDHIARGDISAVMFFSQRTAEIYARLVGKHLLAERHSTITAVCIRNAVAEPLCMLPWRGLTVAGTPDLPHMLEALRSVAPS